MSRPRAVPPACFWDGRHQQAQLLLGMRAARLARQLDAGLPQQPPGGLVEQPVEGIGRQVEPLQRLRHPEGNRQRVLNRRPLGRQLAGADVQKRQRREADGKGNRMPHGLGLDVQRDQQGREQRDKDRLAHPAQPQAGHGDAQLGGAQERVEVRDDRARHLGPAMPVGHERIQLRGADLHQGKLRRHEEAVDRNQPQHEQDLQDDGNDVPGAMHGP